MPLQFKGYSWTYTELKYNSGCLGVTCDEGLGIMLNLLEVHFTLETFRVNLIDIFGSRRPCRKPAVFSKHLDSTNRLASQIFRIDFGGIQCCKLGLLLTRGRRINPFIKGFAHVLRD